MPDIDLGTVAGGSRTLHGYLVEPDRAGPWPGVVMLHEAFGLNDMMRRQADRLASAGYLTLAPDLFSDGGARRCLVSTFRAMFAGQGKAVEDIEAARTHLLGLTACTGKVGVIGFCMGGGFALVVANRGFDAAAPNYGTVPRRPTEALRGACPMVASYGAKDITMRGAATKLERTLTELDIPHDVKEYPSAGHSFLNDEFFGPTLTHRVQRIAHLGPDPAAAPDAWSRIEEFFAEHLG
ncbi:MAG: dienelactone hydrolase family protein [Jatrophihabitans sp.]